MTVSLVWRATASHFIVLAGPGFRTYQKRNQTLKTGTPHENNPVAEKPHPSGVKRNAGYERYVTTTG